MKIKVLSLDTKTATATAVYYLAIVALLVLLGAIVLRFVFAPPCSIIGKNECVVDGWSVAGLAGTVLAVAATLLAILGAVAVAYWWTNLNTKVDQRVDERVVQGLQEQEKKISEQTAHLLKEQEEKFEKAFSKMRDEMDTLNDQASNLEHKLQSIKRDLIIAMTQLAPWDIESWASDEMLLNPSSEVAARMVRKYLEYVDAFFPDDPISTAAIAKYGTNLENISAPYLTPLGYWQKALDWQKRINPQLQSDHAEAVKLWIEKRRPLMEAWQKQQSTTAKTN
ncbi:MAG: hypothetical protein ACJ8DI_13860 [Ktedonobacteraceae bacterium]